MEKWSVHRLANEVQTEADAYVLMERMRWGDTPFCPHCHSERVHFLTPDNGVSRKTRTGSNSERRVWFCGECRKQFSVLTGTVFHGTKISLRKWLFVIFEMTANKNGIAAREIQRKYDLTAKSAWFMTQRIREAMKRGPLAEMMSGTVLADETLIGGSERNWSKAKRAARFEGTPDAPVKVTPGKAHSRHAGPRGEKTVVLSLIDEATGEVRSRIIPDVTGATLRKAIAEQVDMGGSVLVTDELVSYRPVASEFIAHETVNHKEDEYVRYTDRGAITTNQVEGFFSQLKRSIDGTHHHVSKEHLPRYLAEFDFRYSTRNLSDTARTERLFGQVGGRRLTYRRVTGS